MYRKRCCLNSGYFCSKSHETTDSYNLCNEHMPWRSWFTQGNYTLTKILLCKKPLLVVEFESIMFCQDISFLSGICISKTDHFALVTSQYSGGPSREATKAEVTSHISQSLHFPVRRCATASLTALHLCLNRC